MLNIRLTIHSIDYETTIKTVFPQVLRRCKEQESGPLLISLLRELDDTAEAVFLGILKHLPQEMCGELLCECMNVYGGSLTEQINQFLEKDTWGKNFTVGNISLKQNSGELLLVAEEVAVDYGVLLENGTIRDRIGQTAGKFFGDGIFGKLTQKKGGDLLKTVSSVAPAGLEKAGTALLKREDVKGKLLELLGRALTEKGIAVELADLELEVCPAPTENSILERPEKLLLSQELEQAIVKALACYLKETAATV